MNIIMCIFFLLTSVTWADVVVWRVKHSDRAIINFEKKDIIEVGDLFLLENKTGKCLVRVVREKDESAIVSTKQCNFKVGKGDKLTYMTLENRDGKASRKIGEVEDKKTESALNFGWNFEFNLGFTVEFHLSTVELIEGRHSRDY